MTDTGTGAPTDNCIVFHTDETICGQREILVEEESKKKEKE